MGNLAIEMQSDKAPTVDANFALYLSVATENNTSESYDPADVAQIRALSKGISTEIEKIDSEVLPSDRGFKVGEIKKGTRTLLETIRSSKDAKYSKLLESETAALFRPIKPSEGSDAQEMREDARQLRDSFKPHAGDGPLIAMFSAKLSDIQFDALRFAQPTPVIRKDGLGIVTSVELAPMVPIEIERSELTRRRPQIAERLRIFEMRKNSFRGLTKTLSDLVDKRLESY